MVFLVTGLETLICTMHISLKDGHTQETNTLDPQIYWIIEFCFQSIWWSSIPRKVFGKVQFSQQMMISEVPWVKTFWNVPLIPPLTWLHHLASFQRILMSESYSNLRCWFNWQVWGPGHRPCIKKLLQVILIEPVFENPDVQKMYISSSFASCCWYDWWSVYFILSGGPVSTRQKIAFMYFE